MNDHSGESGDSTDGECSGPAEYFESALGLDLRTMIHTIEREARAVSSGDRSGAVDLAQEVWVNLLAKLESGGLPEQVEHPRAWLRTLVRNLAIDGYRKAHTRKRGELPDVPFDDMPPGWEPESKLDGPESLAVQADMSERLRASIAALPTDVRDVVNLILEGRLHREISEILGIPVGTSKTRLRTAAKLLRDDLAPGTH